MPNIIQAIINFTQPFTNVSPLDHSTTLAIQSLGGPEGEFGLTDPTYGGVWSFPLNVPCDGSQISCTIRLRPSPAVMAGLTSGSFTITLVFDNGPMHSATVSFSLAQLQAQGMISSTSFLTGLYLAAPTITGGKIRLLTPVAFADGRVSIGDVLTTAEAYRSVVIGNQAVADVDSSSSVVLGPRSQAIVSSSSVIVGSAAQANNAARCVVIGSDASAQSNSASSVVVGDTALAEDDSWSAVVIGNHAVAQHTAYHSIVIGNQTKILNSFSSICIGSGSQILPTYFGTDNDNLIVIGPNCLQMFLPIIQPTTCPYSIVIGSEATLGKYGAIAPYAIVIGDRADVSTLGPRLHMSPDSIAIGANVANASSTTVNIGADSGSYSDESVVLMGGAGTDGYQTVIIGDSAFCSYSTWPVIVGSEASAVGALGGVVIGRNASLAGTTSIVDQLLYGIAIGSEATIPVNVNYSIAIGYSATTQSNSSLVINTSGAAPFSSIDASSQGATAIGYGVTVETSTNGFALGENSSLSDANFTLIIGQQNIVRSAFFSLALGSNNLIEDYASAKATVNDAHVAIGALNTLGTPSDGSSVFGIGNEIFAKNTLAVGLANSIVDEHVLLLGWRNMGASDAYAIWIGSYITAPTLHAPGSIAIGLGVQAESGTFTIGSHSFVYLPVGEAAIHTFSVRGYNGGPLDTIVATDAPAVSGQIGLNGAGFVNKDIFGSPTPPPTSLLLYVS
jgi:hypothetical protein